TVFVVLFAEEVYSLRLIYEGARSNDRRCNYDGRYVRINLKECRENNNSRNECPAFADGETSKNSSTNFTLEKSEKDEKWCISFNKTYSLAFKGNSTSFENVSCQDKVRNVWFNYEIYNLTSDFKRYRAFYHKQVWKNRCADKEVTDEKENYEPAELNTSLEHFYAEVNNKKGEDYEPESLKVMMASLDRHLKNKGCLPSIVRDREFSSSKEVLEDNAK
ncbi:unnamed protein product, partial [Porites lobata]